MRKFEKLEVVLLSLVGLEILLGLISAVLSCPSCERLNLGWVGAFFYSGLFFSIWRRLERVTNALVCLALAIHAALAVRMLSDGEPCGLCIVAALLCVTISIVQIIQDRSLLRTIGLYLFPLSLFCGLAISWIAPDTTREIQNQVSSVESSKVRLVVFEKKGCPYCERFHVEIEPVIRELFRDKVSIEYRESEFNPSVRAWPTIVMAAGQRRALIEGLPPVQMLSRHIGRLLHGPERE